MGEYFWSLVVSFLNATREWNTYINWNTSEMQDKRNGSVLKSTTITTMLPSDCSYWVVQSRTISDIITVSRQVCVSQCLWGVNRNRVWKLGFSSGSVSQQKWDTVLCPSATFIIFLVIMLRKNFPSYVKFLACRSRLFCSPRALDCYGLYKLLGGFSHCWAAAVKCVMPKYFSDCVHIYSLKK